MGGVGAVRTHLSARKELASRGREALLQYAWICIKTKYTIYLHSGPNALAKSDVTIRGLDYPFVGEERVARPDYLRLEVSCQHLCRRESSLLTTYWSESTLSS